MKEKIKKLSNEEFKLLVGCLRGTYHQFCFSKIGHKDIGGKIYENKTDNDKNFIFIWNSILVSLRSYYLLNFAKIFDKPSYPCKNGERNTLSIFRAITRDKFTKEELETIDSIKSIRDELVAHLDSEALLQGKKLEEDYGLDFEGKKIELLIGKTYELVNQIRGDFDYTHELDLNKERDYIQKEFDKWYNVFKEKYNIKN